MDQTLLRINARRILTQVLDCPVGARIRAVSPTLTSPAQQGRAILYRFKNEDPEFESIHIRSDPDDADNFLWLIRGDAGLVAQPERQRHENRLPDGSSVISFSDIKLKL
jgi:hypothetical protein